MLQKFKKNLQNSLYHLGLYIYGNFLTVHSRISYSQNSKTQFKSKLLQFRTKEFQSFRFKKIKRQIRRQKTNHTKVPPTSKEIFIKESRGSLISKMQNVATSKKRYYICAWNILAYLKSCENHATLHEANPGRIFFCELYRM